MNFNPDEVKDPPRSKSGTYVFTIDGMEEKEFKTRSLGFKASLSVAATIERDIQVFDNLVVVNADGTQSKAAYKLKQLAESVGVTLKAGEVNPVEFLGRRGKAKFATNEKGYLEVDTYLPAPANNGPDDAPPF